MCAGWPLWARCCAMGPVPEGPPALQGVAEAAHPREDPLAAGCREEAAFTLGPEGGKEARPVKRAGMAILGRGCSRCKCPEAVGLGVHEAQSSVKEQGSRVGETGELNGVITRGVLGPSQGETLSNRTFSFILRWLLWLCVETGLGRGLGDMGRPLGKPWP